MARASKTATSIDGRSSTKDKLPGPFVALPGTSAVLAADLKREVLEAPARAVRQSLQRYLKATTMSWL